ncbi:MAG: hypothetical protein P4M04_07910 [Acidobacteriota bacterium]|nr:hypothetical protein [Acidobacteriota bacterium]
MKRNIYGALAILGVALMVSVPLVQAQSRVKADVPFAFSLQDKSMPAGNYEVIALSDRVLEVWNLDSQHGQLLIKQIATQSSKAQNAKLVFHKYGDQYFLSEIWDGRSDTGTGIAESSREKEVKMAANAAPNAPETVVVAMK